MGTEGKWIERDVRYQFTNTYAATISRSGESGTESIDVCLLDMSRGGLKLSVPVELAIHEIVQLHIASEELQMNMEESAQIRWIRKDPDSDGWHVGCQIQTIIDEDVLEQLAERGLLDRRNSARQRVNCEALAQWELREDSVPVRLLNLSSEGFCLASDQPTNIGSRIKLTLCDENGASSHEILARSKWQIDFDNGYMIGCELAVEDIFDLVGYFADSPSKEPTAVVSRRWRKKPLLTGVAILAVVAAVCLSWMVF